MRRIAADPRIVAVDPLGRICLPGRDRNSLLPLLQDRLLYVTLDADTRVFAFSSVQAINDYARVVAVGLGFIETDMREILLYHVVPVPMDDRGRIAIPKELRLQARLGARARVTNFGEYLAIDDPELSGQRHANLVADFKRARRKKYDAFD